MIDLRAARAEPDRFREAVARKGAAEAFDALLDADARWRELVPRVDELRGRQKLKGKPTPEQVAWLSAVGGHGRLWRPENWEAILLDLGVTQRSPLTPEDLFDRTADAASKGDDQ